jgi:hypothetical protein
MISGHARQPAFPDVVESINLESNHDVGDAMRGAEKPESKTATAAASAALATAAVVAKCLRVVGVAMINKLNNQRAQCEPKHLQWLGMNSLSHCGKMRMDRDRVKIVSVKRDLRKSRTAT